MNESELKRYLIKSIRAQGGVGHRFEDRYSVGFPDCLFIPEGGPVFFIEAKMITGAKLVCTEIQGVHLERLWRPKHCYSAVVGFKNGLLFIGEKDSPLTSCEAIPRPPKLDSTDWQVTDLLMKFAKRSRLRIDAA